MPLLVVVPDPLNQSHPGLPDVAEALLAAVKVSPALQFLHGICKQDLNDLVYLLQQLARAFGSFPRLCECVYFYGAAKCGKDALALLLETMLADFSDKGYCSGLPNNYLVKDPNARARNKEDCTPFAASLAGSRVCIVPEVTEGVLDLDAIKFMTEQLGAKVATRGCGKENTRSSPSYLITMFSNHAPTVGDIDGGKKRRLNVFRMRNKFTVRPIEGQDMDDGNLKERIAAQQISMDVFHAVAPWYGVLRHYTTNILRSPHVEEDTKASIADDDGEDETRPDPVRTYVMEKLQPASTSEASNVKDVKTCMAKFFLGKKPKDVVVAMQEAGFSFSDSYVRGTIRYCKYPFVTGQPLSAVKLK